MRISDWSSDVCSSDLIGWPVSLETDIAALGLPACQTPEQKGCILGWASFADPADPAMVTNAYDGTIGFDGRPSADTRMLCTNPLTGIPDTAAPPEAHKNGRASSRDRVSTYE